MTSKVSGITLLLSPLYSEMLVHFQIFFKMWIKRYRTDLMPNDSLIIKSIDNFNLQRICIAILAAYSKGVTVTVAA